LALKSESVGKIPGSSTFVGENVNKAWDWIILNSVLNSPLRAGVFFKSSEKGIGHPIIDMGELFSLDRIESTNGFDLVPVDFLNTPRLRLEFNDILFARVSMASEAGKVSIVKLRNSSCTHSDKAIRANINTDKVDPDFLYYFLSSPIGTALISSISEKTAASSIRKSDLGKLPIPYPPLPVQVAIGSTLSSIDDLISVLYQQNRTITEIANSLFKNWFIDFEPVKANAEGRQPFGKDKAAMELFPDSLEESPIGLIPTGWKVGGLSDLATLNRYTINPQKTPKKLFNYHSIPSFDKGATPVLTFGDEIKSGKYGINKGMILISKLNPSWNRVWLIGDIDSTNSICSTEFLPIMPYSEEHQSYVYLLATSEPFRNMLQSLVTGTSGSHKRVRPDDLMNILIVIPPMEVLEKINKIVSPLLNKGMKNINKIDTLNELRDALSLRLMSGELKIKGVQD
jgi:type I restriction enzyme, S subunit